MRNQGQPWQHNARAPTHLLIVGVLLLLWNATVAVTVIIAWAGKLPMLAADDAAYFAEQPLSFVLLADAGPVAGMAGAVALMLQHKSAIWLFVVQLAAVAIAVVYEIATDTPPALVSGEALPEMLVLFALLAGQIAYAQWLSKRALLY